jgi:hypothetical protein
MLDEGTHVFGAAGGEEAFAESCVRGRRPRRRLAANDFEQEIEFRSDSRGRESG